MPFEDKMKLSSGHIRTRCDIYSWAYDELILPSDIIINPKRINDSSEQ